MREQRLDEVEARLDREDHARIDDARQAQVGMSLRFGDDAAGAILVEAGHVVNLQAEEVADAVWEEGGADALLHDAVRIEIAYESEVVKDRGHFLVRGHVDVDVVN